MVSSMCLASNITAELSRKKPAAPSIILRRTSMRTLGEVALVAAIVMNASPTSSQDATVAAPNNYKVEFENELVRVVRVTYGPQEKSPMHAHQGTPTEIVVLREGGQMHFVNEDGT